METKLPPPPSLRPEDIDPEHFVRIGGPVDRVNVSLRIFGGDLDPDEVTQLLGCSPSLSRRKGDVRPHPHYHVEAREGGWVLRGDQPETMPVEEQILALLGRVTSDLAAWRSLTNRFRCDIVSGLFLEGDNRWFGVSPTLMKALADRGLELGFDIYC